MAKRETDKPPAATLATTATRESNRWSFQRAVAYAQGRLKKSAHMTEEKQWLDPTFRGLDMLASDPEKLLKDARKKEGAFDALRFAVACKMDRNEPLPGGVKAWAASFLRGEIEAPTRKPGTKTTNGKQRAIVRIVSELVEFGGLNARRNDEAKIKDSACDAVSAALRDLQMEPKTFEGVRDLWKKRDKIAPDRFAK